jgi:diguanylate cyclase (GGDEF)-like protein/PAS domain S-box-containing protein
MKISWLKLILLFSALPLLFGTLYFNSRAVDRHNTQKAVDTLRDIETVDAHLNQQVLKVRYSLYADYTPLSKYNKQLKTAADTLDSLKVFSNNRQTLNKTRRLQNQLRHKTELVEKFQAQNILLKNALIDFPALLDNNSLRNGADQRTRSQHVSQTIRQATDALEKDILLYSLANDDHMDTVISNRIESVAQWRNGTVTGLSDYLDKIIHRAQLIVEKTQLVSTYTHDLLTLPVSELTRQTQQVLLTSSGHQFTQSSVYKTLLYGLSIALLAYTSFILIKLRKNSRELTQEKDRALVTLQSIADGVITTDADGIVQFINPVGEKLTGWLTDEAKGKHLTEVFKLHDEVTDHPIEGLVERCISEDRQIGSSEANILFDRQGNATPVQESVSPIKSEEAQIAGAIIVFRDVSPTRELSRKLAYQASHDSLTGVINRRAFDRRLQQAITNAKLNGHQHSLLYLDLDQFKIVNDTCGHDAGDHLLIEVTTMLKQKLRDKDTLARLGGDEFGILLEQCPLECAETFAKEILYEFKQFRFNWHGILFQVGTSIGIVQIHKDTESIVSLLSAADMACYVSKDMGRNRFHVFHNKDKELMRRHGEMQWVSRLTHAFKEGRFTLYASR